MHNNTRTQNQSAPVQNQGESAAINKLTENEDENADSCGCGSSHDRAQSQNNVQGRRPENLEKETEESADDREQNRLANQMTEPTGDPEDSDRLHTQNQNRSSRKMDETEAETGEQDLSVNPRKRPDVDDENTTRFQKEKAPTTNK